LDCSSSTNVAYICGDSRCDSARGEALSNCPADCRCGNGLCEATLAETSDSCPVDCPREKVTSVCNGNGSCDQANGETAALCPGECTTTTAVCGDGTCESNRGETATSCVRDCVPPAPIATTRATVCGNTICETGETVASCPSDCKAATAPTTGYICGDQLCQRDRGESDLNCERDCPKTITNTTITCTDSDGGKTPKVKGTVKFGAAVYVDACVDERQLRESFCDDNRNASVVMNCEEGTTCQAGACLPPPAKTAAPAASMAPVAPMAPVLPVPPPTPSAPSPVASAPIAPGYDRVSTPSGETIALPDECVRAGITKLEDCRARLTALKEIPATLPATLAAAPTAAAGLPLVCTTQGLLNSSSCEGYLTKIAKEQRTAAVAPPMVTLTRDQTGRTLSDRCFSLGYSSTASCAYAATTQPVSMLPATAADTVRGDLPEACTAHGVTKPTECAELLKTFSLPDACAKAGMMDMAACQAYLAAQRRPAACAVSGQLADASCLPVAEKAFLPPLCQQLGQTDADQCRDAVFAKYGLPKACAGMTKETCWRLVQTGELNDKDFAAAASKDLVTAACLNEGAVTLSSCGKKAVEATLPEDCLLAGRYTARDCDRFLFEKGRQTAASDTLSGVCAAAKITDAATCAAYLTTSRLPVECAKAGLTDVEACNKFIAALDLPSVCRDAGVTSRDECEAMLRKRAETKSCTGLLANAKIDDAARSGACDEVIYRQTAAKVVCEGLTPSECEANAKTRHLGSIAEAAGRLDTLQPLEEAAAGGVVQLGQWKKDHATADLPLATIVGHDDKLTVLASRAAIVIKESGAVETASQVVTIVDTDGDGLSDDVEKRLGTDATKASTDGQTPDRKAVKQRTQLTGIDRALADGQPLGQPLAEGVADDRLQVTTATPAMLSGRGVPGEVITIYLYSDLPLVATTTVDENGQWQLTIDGQLGEGVHEAYVAINDDTGRVTRKSEPLAFIVQAAQAITPAAAAQEADATAADVNVAATSAPTKDLGLFIIGGIMLLLAAGLTIAIIVFTRKR
jgi:hypothetical protein